VAVFAAVSFALVLLFGGRLMQTVPPVVLNLHVAALNAVLFTAVALLGNGFIWPAVTRGWAGLIGGAIFFVLGFLGLFVGVTLVGSSRAACLTNVEPVVTVGLAIVMLGEPFSGWQVVGVTAVLAGILIMCRHILDEVRAIASGDELRQIRALTRQLYCTPACRDGDSCSLVDGNELEGFRL